MVQLSHLYMTTEKAKALTRQTFVGKVMYLLFNMLSRFVIAFLPMSNHLLNLWLYIYTYIYMCVDIYIYIIFFFRFFSIKDYFKILSRVPCAIQ